MGINLFGFEIRRNNKNNIYVRTSECHEAQNTIKEMLNHRIDDLMNHIDTRITDLKDFIKNGK